VSTGCVVTGRVTEDGKLVLDERLPDPIVAGPVRVSIQAMPGTGAVHPGLMISEEEWERRRTALLALAGSLPDEEAKAMIKMREEEFDQIDPDDWR
jgi:hypothetical protein